LSSHHESVTEWANPSRSRLLSLVTWQLLIYRVVLTRSFHPRGGVSVLVQQVRGGGHILRPLAPEEKISGGGNILWHRYRYPSIVL